MSDSPEQQQRKTSRNTNWPPSAQAPADDFDIMVLFHGLFCFSYKERKQVCEIGTHNKAPHHKFGLFVLEFDAQAGSAPSLIYWHARPDGVAAGPISLSAERPKNQSVSFFQSGGHEQDWGRVPDFEGPRFYNTRLNRDYTALDPIITIEQGLFYTVTTTLHEFHRVAEGNETDTDDLGQVAFLVGADVSHEEGGRVWLRVGGEEPLRLEATGGKKYLIFFANVCLKHQKECDFDHNSPHKEKRNDFYLYYKTFEKPAQNQKEYMLKLKRLRAEGDAKSQPAPPSFQRFFSLELLNRIAPLSNDKAPCGAVGFGLSGD